VKRVVVLISGRGSNLQALISAQNENWQIVGVVTDNEKAPGLKIANDAGIFSIVAPRCHLEPLWIALFQPDLVVLAGFMKILKQEVVGAFKIINIHPSLLPKYPGLNTHQRALDAEEIEHGCTVHWVDGGVDTGEIIDQSVVSVVPGDTASSLGARVLEAEHKLLTNTVNKLLGDCPGRVLAGRS